MTQPFLPSLWSDHIMKVMKSNISMAAMKPSAIETAMMRMLASKAQDEGVSTEHFALMNFRAKSDYDINHQHYRIRIDWRDPTGEYEERRGYDYAVDDRVMEDLGLFAEQVRHFMDQIKIRGELFFFKLHKHFPKKLKQVHTLRDGKIVVEFKNGRTVESHESRLDDKEFLAECVMIHDL